MLKPFYMLQGKVNLIKEIRFRDKKNISMIEKHWQDEKGNKAITIIIDRKNELIQK